MRNVARYDFGKLGKATVNGAGAARINASLTRPGVFVYEGPSGPVREYRPPEEVFDPESIASMNGVPVTILHPDVPTVGPDNVNDLRHGYLIDGAAFDESTNHVVGVLQLDTSDVQNGVNTGSLAETSMGYRCDLDPTPGVSPEGEEYDVVQRSIRYNHVALGPQGWGRMGRDCRLHVDSASPNVVITGIRLDSNGNILPEKPDTKEKIMKVIRIDNQEFEMGSPEHIAFLDATIKKLMADVAALTARAEGAEGSAEVAVKQADELTKELETEKSPEKVDEKVEERMDCIATARKVIGDKFDHKGKTNRKIREEVLTAMDPSFRADGKSDAFIDGAFFTAGKSGPTKTWQAPAQKPVVEAPPAARQDADVPAWKRPLAASKR